MSLFCLVWLWASNQWYPLASPPVHRFSTLDFSGLSIRWNSGLDKVSRRCVQLEWNAGAAEACTPSSASISITFSAHRLQITAIRPSIGKGGESWGSVLWNCSCKCAGWQQSYQFACCWRRRAPTSLPLNSERFRFCYSGTVFQCTRLSSTSMADVMEFHRQLIAQTHAAWA